MAPRSVSFFDSSPTSSSPSPAAAGSNHNNNTKHNQRSSLINSLRVSTCAPVVATAMSPSSPLLYESANNDTGSISAPLIDRLAFVLVDDDDIHANSSRLAQIWWPAWIFETASEMFHELSLATQHRAALMQEFFEVGRQHPAQAQQHVAYLLGPTSIIPGHRRTIYGCSTRDFWTISDEVVTNCSEYPGWCDACLAAPELSDCNWEGNLSSPTHAAAVAVHAAASASASQLSPSHRTSTSPLRGSAGGSPLRGMSHGRSYVSPTSSPVRSGRSYEYEEESRSPTARSSTASALSTRAVKYRRRRNFN